MKQAQGGLDRKSLSRNSRHAYVEKSKKAFKETTKKSTTILHKTGNCSTEGHDILAALSIVRYFILIMVEEIWCY